MDDEKGMRNNHGIRKGNGDGVRQVGQCAFL